MENVMLTVGFDGKRAVQNMTGLGNYSRLVAGVLSARYPSGRYVLLVPRRCDNPRLEPLLLRENVELYTPEGAITKRLGGWWRSVEMVHDWPRLGLDIYHGLSNEIPLTSGLAPCPTVVTIHDLIWRRFPSDYPAVDRVLYEQKYRRSARLATRVIAISERTKADMIADWGIDPAKIDVIYQGCDPMFSRAVTLDEKAAVRKKYNLPKKYIVTVGTVQGRKNQLLSVKGLHGLPADVKLVIAGGAHEGYRAEIDRYIKENRLGDRVVWLSSVPLTDLPALYSCALFSSYTSRYEGFGIPVIESLSVSTPVVACTGSCLEEAGGNGALYVGPDDVEGYIEAAGSLIENAWLRDKLAEQGQRHIKRFNEADFATSIMKTYNKAILEHSLKSVK